MGSSVSAKPRIPVREMTTLSLLGAMMTGGKEAMAVLPNIHPVALFIVVTTVVYGLKALYPVYIFVIVEGFLYGFGSWFFGYLYVWAILVLLIMPLRKLESPVMLASVAGLFGLCFGALFAIPYIFIGGWRYALTYWISGIPFDLLHAGGNFVLVLLLSKPCVKILRRLSISAST